MLYQLCSNARSERELFYDAKAGVLFTPAQKYCATVEFPSTLSELIARMRERFGVEIPLSDQLRIAIAATSQTLERGSTIRVLLPPEGISIRRLRPSVAEGLKRLAPSQVE